jgi:hypothetical protein
VTTPAHFSPVGSLVGIFLVEIEVTDIQLLVEVPRSTVGVLVEVQIQI